VARRVLRALGHTRGGCEGLQPASSIFATRGALEKNGLRSAMTDLAVILRKLSVLRDHAARARRRRLPSADVLVGDQDR
jgi:hypothetical protein